MSRTTPGPPQFGLLLIFGSAIGLLALHVMHALEEGENLYTFIYGIGIPMAVSIGLLIGGIWLWHQDIDEEYQFRVAVWVGVGAVVVSIVAILTILYQDSEGVTMSDQLYVVSNGATGGALVGFFLGIYNIRLQIARREANRLSEQLTVLNRVLRHDIRNKANVISGNAAILADSTADIQNRARTIQRQATDLVEVGDQAREIEQLFHDEGFEPDVVNLTSVVKRQSEEVEHTYPAAEISTALPEEELVTAHPLIDSAIRNVIENAVEHNDKDTPQVAIDLEYVPGPREDTVELQIADNGPGFKNGEIEVLKRGYETDLEHTSGIGLWLVNWVVEKSGGAVRFEENVPEGSVVCLALERPASTET